MTMVFGWAGVVFFVVGLLVSALRLVRGKYSLKGLLIPFAPSVGFFVASFLVAFLSSAFGY